MVRVYTRRMRRMVSLRLFAASKAGVELPLEAVMFEGLFQPMHLLMILLIALLVFGPEKAGGNR